MKQLIVAVAYALSLSTIANTTVVTSHPSTGISIGFSDSSFNYPQFNNMSDLQIQEELEKVKFCFKGDSEQVCQHISEQVFNINACYSGGAHDRIDLKKCQLVINDLWNRDQREDKIKVFYTLEDDYGTSQEVVRTIGACPRS